MERYFPLDRLEPVSVREGYAADRPREQADLVGTSLAMAALVLGLIWALHLWHVPQSEQFAQVVEARQSYNYPHLGSPR